MWKQEEAEEERIRKKVWSDQMKVKFINIGNRNVNFEKECKGELNYEWLLKQVRPYLLSPSIDFDYNKKRNNNCICRNANSRRNRGNKK